MQEKRYGLFTVITMIVGIVIGSGIFFKSDNILIATNGNILLGIMVFAIAAFCIILGCLTIAELAARTEGAGGLIAYAEKFCSKSMACVFGWFQIFLYYPTLIVVIAWVSGIYISILLGLPSTLEVQMIIGVIATVFLFFVNTTSAKLGGLFQNAATIIKLIPLILIAIVGLFFSDFSTLTTQDFGMIKSAGWISAIVPIAFSFDGWVVATSISNEVKNSKRNLPLALIFAPLFVLFIYITYFTGISLLVGPDQVMALGDEHVNVAANMLFGDIGAKIILLFVVISITGTLNGIIMGLIRLPYSLGLQGMLPASDKLKELNPKYNMPVNSSILALFITGIWYVIHYLTQKFNLLPNSDVSEISIVMSYVLYIILYIQVYKLGTSGEVKGFIKGRVLPIMATLGSLVILAGGAQNPLFIYYCIFCLIIITSAIVFWRKKEKTLL